MQGNSKPLTQRVGAGSKALAIIASLAAVFATIFAALPVGSALAASGITIVQSNDSIVMDDDSKKTNNISVRVLAQPNDVVTIKLDHHLWSSGTWLTSFPYGTMTEDEDSDTATLTFSKLTNTQVVAIPVVVAPSVSYAQTIEPLSDDAIAKLVSPGDYSVDVTTTHSDGTSESQTASFSVSSKGYSTGTSWTDTSATLRMGGSYVKGTQYSFSLPTALSVKYADDSLTHPTWMSAKTAMTLSIPGGFELDAAASPGWTQNTDGSVSFDPTVSGASTRITGQFTKSEGTYTGTGTSTISGYFASSKDKQTLELANPITINVLDHAQVTQPTQPSTPGKTDPVLTFERWNSATVAIPPADNLGRPGMQNMYNVEYKMSVPATSTSGYTDVIMDVRPPDGSYLSAGTLKFTKPAEGATISVDLTSPDGETKTITHTVSSSDTKGLTIQLPAASNSGWLSAYITLSHLQPGDKMDVAFPKTTAQQTFRDGTTIPNGTVKGSATRMSGVSEETGLTTVKAYTEDAASNGPKATYMRTLTNADYSLQIGGWRSAATNIPSTVYYYGGSGSNLKASYWTHYSPETTTTKIFEPIMYEMLPQKTVLVDATVDPSIPTPKTTTFQTSDGRTVVKFDWTGTGYWLDGEDGGSPDNKKINVNWKPADKGVDTTSPAAIWISTVNDKNLVLKPSRGATPVGIASELASEATQADSYAVLIGTLNVHITNKAGYDSFGGDLSVTDNRGTTSTRGANILNSTSSPEHSLNYKITNTTSSDISPVFGLINLPTDLSLQLTGEPTIVSGGATLSSTDIMYSTTDVAPPSEGSDLQGGGNWLPATLVTILNQWSKVRAIMVTVPTSGAQTEYQLSIPVTDLKAQDETKKWGTITATTYAEGFPAMTSTAKDSYSLMEGVKNWDDDNDAASIRPDSIKVNLVDGSGKTAETVTATQWSSWHYDFDSSPVDANGNFINYTVAEAQIPNGYVPSSEGLDLTNKLGTLLSALPLTGGTGYSYTSLALVFAGVAVIAGGTAGLVGRGRRARKV